MTPLENIRAKVSQHCSPERRALLEPILVNLEINKACPASTTLSKHGAFEGGLLAHTNVVMDLALGYAQALFNVMADQAEAGGELSTEQIEGEGVVTAVLIHDLNKTQDLSGNKHYIENVLKDGKKSEKKPWKVNEAYDPLRAALNRLTMASDRSLVVLLMDQSIQYPSGLVSLAIAEQWSPGIVPSLTPEEKQAIVWHGSLYEKGNKAGFVNNESLLQILVHCADMSASRLGI